MVVILLLIISIIVIGSKVVFKDNFVVIEGTITLEPNLAENISMSPVKFKQTSFSINYPTGFNKGNCVVISKAFGFPRQQGLNYVEGWNNYPNNVDAYLGVLPHDVMLGDNAIQISLGNYMTSEMQYSYKIVLMKIS